MGEACWYHSIPIILVGMALHLFFLRLVHRLFFPCCLSLLGRLGRMVFVALLICGVGPVWSVRGFDGRLGTWLSTLHGFAADREGSTGRIMQVLGVTALRDNADKCWDFSIAA
ncbi:hypothetical protein BJY00DRAFT_280568 [Aspergillus carlsbadensis]|nr:hypothetical protein BJY00DRAFT_280568 [Aspergillus carlsbadensis]